jgi:hypothetical protein
VGPTLAPICWSWWAFGSKYGISRCLLFSAFIFWSLRRSAPSFNFWAYLFVYSLCGTHQTSHLLWRSMKQTWTWCWLAFGSPQLSTLVLSLFSHCQSSFVWLILTLSVSICCNITSPSQTCWSGPNWSWKARPWYFRRLGDRGPQLTLSLPFSSRS